MSRRITGENYVIIDRSVQFLRVSRKANKAALQEIGKLVRAEAKRLARKERYPPPSRPGQPPARRTGFLVRSIDFRIIDTGLKLFLRLGTPIRYGFFVELGTRRMAARPFLRPAIRKSARKINRLLARAYRDIS